jgi:hypothetical protein
MLNHDVEQVRVHKNRCRQESCAGPAANVCTGPGYREPEPSSEVTVVHVRGCA